MVSSLIYNTSEGCSSLHASFSKLVSAPDCHFDFSCHGGFNTLSHLIRLSAPFQPEVQHTLLTFVTLSIMGKFKITKVGIKELNYQYKYRH